MRGNEMSEKEEKLEEVKKRYQEKNGEEIEVVEETESSSSELFSWLITIGGIIGSLVVKYGIYEYGDAPFWASVLGFVIGASVVGGIKSLLTWGGNDSK